MQSDENRKRVIETAVRQFNEHGCRAVTMDSLASALHISKRTLYEMFDNKETLLLECITQVYRTLGNERLLIVNQTKDPFLMTLYITRNETVQGQRYARILKDAIHLYPELTMRLLKKYSDHFKEVLTKIFTKADANGDLRPDIDIDRIVETIAMIVNIFSHNCPLDDEKQMSHMRESYYTFLRGLLSVKAIQRYDENEMLFKNILETNYTNH